MITQSAVLLKREISDIGQGVAQICSMSPILINSINQLLDEVEKAVIGINIKKDVQVGGLMFADDFVGLTPKAEDLLTLINVVQGFCRLKSNIKRVLLRYFLKRLIQAHVLVLKCGSRWTKFKRINYLM